jgi:hypothetical protein
MNARTSLIAIATGIFLMVPINSLAQDKSSTAVDVPVYFQAWVAKIKVSQGTVSVVRKGKSYPGPVGVKLKVEDAVVTDADASVGLTFLDNSTISLGPNSEVQLLRYNYDPNTYDGAIEAFVKKGTASLTAGNLAEGGPENIRITTPKSELRGNAKQVLINLGDAK